MASNLAASTPIAKRLTKEKAVKLQKRLQAAVFGVTVGRQGTKLEELVRLYDVDGDGVLDPRELTRLIRYDFKIGKHDVEDEDIALLVAALDHDNNGTLDAAEFMDFVKRGLAAFKPRTGALGPGVVRRDQRKLRRGVCLGSHENERFMWLHGEERRPDAVEAAEIARSRASADAAAAAAAAASAERTLQPHGGGGGTRRGGADAEAEMYLNRNMDNPHTWMSKKEMRQRRNRHADLRERAAHRRARNYAREAAEAGGRELGRDPPSPAPQSPEPPPRPRSQGHVKDWTFYRRSNGQSVWNDLYFTPAGARIEGVVTRDVLHGDAAALRHIYSAIVKEDDAELAARTKMIARAAETRADFVARVAENKTLKKTATPAPAAATAPAHQEVGQPLKGLLIVISNF